MTEESENEDKQVDSMTDAEKNIANSGPAVYSNRFLGSLGPSGVRVTFAELGLNGNLAFRTAVMMSIDDAKSLQKMLLSLVEQHDAFAASKVGQTGK